MDYIPHFRREILAFEAAVRGASGADRAPLVPSCPEWSVSDLVAHLGWVHRFVAHIVGERLLRPPTAEAIPVDLPARIEDWPAPERAPNRGPLPSSLIDWFAAGAAALEALFTGTDPGEPVWTWSRERTTGFWLRMQTIEAAVHRWDAENATGVAQPVDAELAADAIDQNFAVMVPARRAHSHAPPGSGERFRFRQTDGAGDWMVLFDGGDVRPAEGAGPWDAEVAGTASDLMLFLWHRIPADRLDEVPADRGALDRYFTLAPPE